MPLTLYYILVFSSALFYEDFSNIELFRLGGLAIYIVDLINVLIGLSVIRFLMLKVKPRSKQFRICCWFLGWILVAVLIGLPKFSFRAIGELRTMSNYFAFFVPFILIFPKKDLTNDDIINVLRNTMFLAAIATLIIFIIEISIGGRFFISQKMNEVAGGLEDFRGIRILNSDHAFHLTALIILVIIGYTSGYRQSLELTLAAILLLLIVLLSKNRTAFISIAMAFFIWMLLKGYFRLLVGVMAALSLVFGILILTSPAIANAVSQAFSGVLNVSEDDTGKFRLMIQAVAIQQGLQHPFIGEGFGGYFDYYIPELGITYDVPPHSMYVYLFQKTGIAGVLLCCATIWSLCSALYRMQKQRDPNFSSRELVYINLLLILLLAQTFYGLAYNFTMFFGLYAAFAVLLIENNFNSKKDSLVNA